jgi:hypothetical protein
MIKSAIAQQSRAINSIEMAIQKRKKNTLSVD